MNISYNNINVETNYFKICKFNLHKNNIEKPGERRYPITDKGTGMVVVKGTDLMTAGGMKEKTGIMGYVTNKIIFYVHIKYTGRPNLRECRAQMVACCQL